jgi:hypothetical protein
MNGKLPAKTILASPQELQTGTWTAQSPVFDPFSGVGRIDAAVGSCCGLVGIGSRLSCGWCGSKGPNLENVRIFLYQSERNSSKFEIATS